MRRDPADGNTQAQNVHRELLGRWQRTLAKAQFRAPDPKKGAGAPQPDGALLCSLHTWGNLGTAQDQRLSGGPDWASSFTRKNTESAPS